MKTGQRELEFKAGPLYECSVADGSTLPLKHRPRPLEAQESGHRRRRSRQLAAVFVLTLNNCDDDYPLPETGGSIYVSITD